METKLTLKQAKFISAYIESGNASEAYRLAYNAGKMKPETVNRKAWDLLQNGKISARIDALRRDAAKLTVLSEALVIHDLIAIKTEAMKPDPATNRMIRPEVATRALELLGKKLGMWNPDTTIAVGINTRPSFEGALAEAKVIVVQNGSPEMERKIAYDLGRLYQKWLRGEALPKHPVAGGYFDENGNFASAFFNGNSDPEPIKPE
ncbi:terminase small subunit [Leptospirillum ferriphilum]|uniref:Terminase small subunit n=1 Tax=Leptospirillum ferriphilum (strain ML-04) TaxID=1048260 RepID=J9Z9A2_LEPFM|nr:terminase small subunit [Leptospirillum ferriphilum]AFS53105.1 terminase small subunit [Leptospirillum ferriphilum ML-04]